MTTDAVGGVWTYALALARELSGRGDMVRLAVIGPSPSTDRIAAARAAGVDWVSVEAELDWLANGEIALAHGRAAIARAAKAWNADILQVNQPAYAGGEYAAPLVTVAHSCVLTWWLGTHGCRPPPEWDWHIRAVGQGMRQAAIAVAPSRSFAAMLQRAYGLEHQPIAVLNGMAARPSALPALKEQIVLASGRVWDESKNFVTLEAAAPLIEWKVQIAGDRAAPGHGDSGSSQRPHHLGRLSAAEMARHYARAAIYVSPSLQEPFGLGVLEAARQGAALILSDIDSFRELWGGAALFFDPKDAQALAAAVNRLIDAPDQRQELAEAARMRAARYSIAETAKEMRAVHGRAAAWATKQTRSQTARVSA